MVIFKVTKNIQKIIYSRVYTDFKMLCLLSFVLRVESLGLKISIRLGSFRDVANVKNICGQNIQEVTVF